MIHTIKTVPTGSDELVNFAENVWECTKVTTPKVILRGDDTEYAYPIVTDVRIVEEQKDITLGVFHDLDRELGEHEFWDRHNGLRKVLKRRVFDRTNISFEITLQDNNYPSELEGNIDVILSFNGKSIILNKAVMESVTNEVMYDELIMEIKFVAVSKIESYET